MNEKQRMAKALDIFNKMKKTMEMVYFRWLDEHEYEDFNTYQALAMKRMTELGGTYISFNKKGKLTWKLEGCTYEIKINCREYSYRRIA